MPEQPSVLPAELSMLSVQTKNRTSHQSCLLGGTAVSMEEGSSEQQSLGFTNRCLQKQPDTYSEYIHSCLKGQEEPCPGHPKGSACYVKPGCSQQVSTSTVPRQAETQLMHSPSVMF